MRAVLGRSTAIRFRLEDEYGDLVDADGSVHVDVTDGAGAPVSSGEATRESLGVYAYRVYPEKLDDLTAVATAAVDGFPVRVTEQVRVVGSHVFRLADLKASGIDTELLLPLEDEVASAAERVLGYSPVPAGYRYELRLRQDRSRIVVRGMMHLLSVYSLTDESGNEIETRVLGNAVVRADGADFAAGLYRLHAACGLESTPHDLSQACLSWATYLVQTRGAAWDPRTVRVMVDGGEAYLARVGPDRPTGYPDVDSVLVGYRITHYIGSTADAVV